MTHTETLSPAQKAWVTRRANGWKPATAGSYPYRRDPVTGLTSAQPAQGAPTPIAPDARPPKPRRLSEAEQAARAYGKAKADHSILEPVTEFRQVEIDLDDPIVGMGNRRFTVLAQNANKVRLFYAPLLVTTEVDRRYFDQHHRPALKGNRAKLAEIIRHNIARADRVNLELFEKGKGAADYLPDGGVEAQRVLELLAPVKKGGHR